ncbi:Flp pilus assembly protein CpaB [Streptomyces chumphonensis]|uniref:Flp pilus assembly protein CpaB n=1 Tax=Streptomyces chumphonensis TaxID=1214925 RepID=A0A927F3K3_9ACTN|nr:Flp pilus assembly protein CpaB [Streptomyces chumphonensis]MBD3933544.1 Flp pilus assembly protein CpaB [Streptomyces chumphonensis]
MNSRQRRGILLMLLSVLGALVAFGGVLAVVNDVESKVGPEVNAYEVKEDVEPYQELRPEQFSEVSMPERWLPDTAVTDLDAIRGKIALNPLKPGSLLQRDMIADRPALEAGQQEIAIMIDSATGVAGKITPGARVNVYATFRGEGEAADVSQLIVESARVIDVGELTSIEDTGDADSGRTRGTSDAVPITFALDTRGAQRIAYAESFATHVRLALVAPGDAGGVPQDERTYTLGEDK